jgi:hypothetical protein
MNGEYYTNTGWVCPKCGRVLAPWVHGCCCVPTFPQYVPILPLLYIPPPVQYPPPPYDVGDPPTPDWPKVIFQFASA